MQANRAGNERAQNVLARRMGQPSGVAMTVLGEWQGEQVGVGDVLEALEGLRRGEARTATRTSVLTLIVVAADADDAARAGATVAALGARHPARTLLLFPAPADTADTAEAARINADVQLLCAEVEGADVWSEQVTLTVPDRLHAHLASLIEPFTLPDLPVAVWYVSDLPALADPLLDTADAVLVDTKELGDTAAEPEREAANVIAAFPSVAELTRRHTVVDLSWTRLRPWRELLAGLFEGSAFRPFASQVEAAEVDGKEGPRHLLAGWLASRLHLAPDRFTLQPARHVTLRLKAGGAEFEVTRSEGERLVRARAEVEGGPHHRDVLPLPDESLPWSLADALTHLERDKVYEQALRAALAF
jgi:glucose-6-phosphate dehydrogenase assembly protein OpcA